MPGFGRWLKDQMTRLEMNQSELASCVGVSHVAVSHWVSGVSGPSPASMAKLARVLEVPVSELYVAMGRIPPREAFADLPEEKRALIEYVIGMDDATTSVFGEIARRIERLRAIYASPARGTAADEVPTDPADSPDE